jgi:hypothetical protein
MVLTDKQTKQRDRFRADMTSILGGVMGQPITFNRKTKTYDANGKYTGATNVSTTKNAVISYITQDNDVLVSAGKAKVGDAKLFMEYDSTLEREDEITDASGDVWRVIEIYNKPEVYGTFTEIHAIIRRSHSK